MFYPICLNIITADFKFACVITIDTYMNLDIYMFFSNTALVIA